MKKKSKEYLCKVIKGLVANLDVNRRAFHVVRQSLDGISLKITNALESGKEEFFAVVSIFSECGGIESLFKLVEDSEDNDLLEETFVLLSNVLQPTIEMLCWNPKKLWIEKHVSPFIKKILLLGKQNYSVITAGSKVIELVAFLNIPRKGLLIDTRNAVKELIQSIEHQLNIAKKIKAFDLPSDILMPVLRLFLVLCRTGSPNIRKGVKYLLDLVELSDPSSPTSLRQLHGLHNEVFLSVVMIKKKEWYPKLVEAGLLKILTKKIEEYNRRFIVQAKLTSLNHENLSLTEYPKCFLSTISSRCFVMEEAPSHYTGYYDPKNSPYHTNMPIRDPSPMPFKDILDSFIAREHHLLALRVLHKLMPNFVFWSSNKTKLMEPILDYLTLTLYPDPIAASLLVKMASMNLSTTGVVEGNDGTFPIEIYRRLVIGEGFKCRLGDDCRLHNFLRGIGQHVLDCLLLNMKKDLDGFIHRQEVIERRTADSLLLTRKMMTISIIASSLEEVISFGYNSKSLMETLELLKSPQNAGDALVSLSSLAKLIEFDQYLCPPTPKLEDVFKNFGCRVSDMEPDVYFDISSEAAVQFRLHIISSETRSYSFRDRPEMEQINQELPMDQGLIEEIQMPVGACKSLLVRRCDYFKALLDGDFAEGNAGSFDNPVVLPKIPVKVLTSIFHILYGCGRNCPVIIHLETLLRDHSFAIDLLRYLEFFSVGVYVQRISDFVANQPLDPFDYVGLLVKLGGSICGRQWFRHLLCLPFCANSKADLNFRWGLIYAVFFSPLSRNKFVVLPNGSEISAQDFMVSMYAAAFLKGMKLEQFDSEEDLSLNLGYYNLIESLPPSETPLDYDTDCNNLILRRIKLKLNQKKN